MQQQNSGQRQGTRIKTPLDILFSECEEQSKFEGGGHYEADIDLYIVCDNLIHARNKIIDILNKISNKLIVQCMFVRTNHAITIVSEKPYRHIQIAVSCFKNIQELMSTADLDCTAFIYDGSQVWFHFLFFFF